MWFPDRSDTNQAVQSQKRARSLNFGFKKKRKCTIRVAKTKALISFAVTAKLICVFVFAYAYCWFSHEAAHLCSKHWLWVHVQTASPMRFNDYPQYMFCIEDN